MRHCASISWNLVLKVCKHRTASLRMPHFVSRARYPSLNAVDVML